MLSKQSFSNSNVGDDSEVDPSYDDLASVVEKLGTLLEKRNRKIKNLMFFMNLCMLKFLNLKP